MADPSRGPPLQKRAYEISNLLKDFKISGKISDLQPIQQKISRFNLLRIIVCNLEKRGLGSLVPRLPPPLARNYCVQGGGAWERG